MNTAIFFIQILILGLTTALVARYRSSEMPAWIFLEMLLCNLFVLKEVDLFGFSSTAAEGLAVSVVLGLNLYQEIHGKKAVMGVLLKSFCGIFLFLTLFFLHNAYIPNAFDKTQEMFLFLYAPLPRMLLVSLSLFFFLEILDIVLFQYLKKVLDKASFFIRAFLLTILVEGIDSTLFTFFALGDWVGDPLSVIVVSWGIKVVALTLFLLSLKIVYTPQPVLSREG